MDNWTMDTTLAQTSILGAMLISPAVIGETLTALRPEDFNEGIHRDTFTAIRDLFLNGAAVDPVTVRDKLGGTSPERSKYLMELMDTTPTAQNFREYAAIVRSQSRLRQLQRLGALLTEAGDLDAAQGLVEQANDKIVDRRDVRSVNMQEALIRFYDRVDCPREYLTWGLRFLDEGLYAHPGSFIILGGRPSDGKTALALTTAYHQAQTRRVGFFSLETDEDTLFDRLFTSVAQVSGKKIRRGTLSQEDCDALARQSIQVQRRDLHLVQAAGMSVADIQAYTLARRFDVIYVDYLQLIRAEPGQSRTEEVTRISMGLHTMAQKNKIAVVALSQLSRAGKGEGGKAPARPTLASLRESGQIEQDADVVLFIYREEPDRLRSRRILSVAKNKEGETGEIPLFFNGDTQRFREDLSGLRPELDPPPSRLDQITITAEEQKNLPF